MLYLIRVYKDDRVVFALTLDRKESFPAALGLERLRTDCRCICYPDPYEYLAQIHGLGEKKRTGLWKYEHGYLDQTTIYPTPRTKRTK